MISQKITFSHNFLWVNFRRNFTFLLGLCLSILIFNFNSASVFALYTPILSASVDQVNLQVNGNQVINSVNKTAEIPLNLTVNTNNKTGYTATLNSETDETALVNNDSSNGAKINSVSANLSLNNLPNNTWGYKFGASSGYSPIPALSTPAQILQTTGKTNGNESNQLSIGMKLSDNLESGRYTNKLIFSILTNNYNHIAIMTEGPDFNTKLKALETATNKIEHFKKSAVAPATSMNAVNIDDEESDYEIKLWLEPTDKTAYYYAETEKVYLNVNSSKMFSFTSLTSLNLSSFNTTKVINMTDMFSHMHGLTSLDLSNFDTSNVRSMSDMFSHMSRLTSLDLSNFDTSNVIGMSSMFSNMSSLTSLNLSNFDTSQVVDMSNMFSDMSRLTSLDLSNFDTSNVTNMGGMFTYLSSLTSLNLSSFNTSKVTNMEHMFRYMSSLTSLDLSNFDTSQVVDMNNMFSGMNSLTSLNLSSFNTSKVTNMSHMFSYMHGLTSLNLSNFDTSNVTNMNSMFTYMSGLTNINLLSFNTENVEDMGDLFRNAINLVTIDLSSFNTKKVKDMSNMFLLSDEYWSDDKLEKIYVNNDFNTSELISFSGMFVNRVKLRGGNGSYLDNPLDADKSWLRIDDPANGRPGYFTRKS